MNDRTRPPDVEALAREAFHAGVDAAQAGDPVAGVKAFDAIMARAAAYQPTGPDDLAGLRREAEENIAAMLHYRGRVLHPRSHSKAAGGPCDECIESARQAMEFMR